eukprot:scaffold97397_cov27-Phaeocystis_antarctica.AAC.1
MRRAAATTRPQVVGPTAWRHKSPLGNSCNSICFNYLFNNSNNVYQKPNTTHMAYRLRYPEYGVGIREQVVHASSRSHPTCYHP